MKKILLAIIAVLLLAVLASALFFYLRPIAVISYLNRRALVKAGFQKKVVDTPFGPQVTFEAGAGPTLVLLHGAGDNAGTWAKVAPHFSSRYHVVAVDLPGHGESSPAMGPLKMATMVRDLGGVLNKLDCPCIVVGNSLGGWLAMVEAVNTPEKFARIVAVDGGPMLGERPDLARVPATRAEAARIWDAVLDPGSPRIPGFILDDVVRQSHQGAIGRLAAAGDMQRFLLDEERLRAFSVPVDLLWGESDRLVPLDYAQKMQAQLPAARLNTLARCGHIPQAECPVAFTAALDQILTQAAPVPGTRLKEAGVKDQAR